MFGLFRKQPKVPLTLEQKLVVLAECGLSLAPEFTVHDLLDSWPREEFEKPGFTATLVGLGMTEERPPWRSCCINTWHFDTECIEDEGSYVQIARRLAEMTQGSLMIENVRDEVDIESGVASLTFEHAAKLMHFDLKVNNDWVDATVFSRFAKLLAISDPSKVFLHYDMRGQDCILTCVSRDQFAALTRAGLDFKILT